MNKYLRNFLYILPVLLLGMSIFLSNRTSAQSDYWPWVDLAYPGFATNITSNSATLNGTLSFSNAVNASNVNTQVWFEYYKWDGNYSNIQRLATPKQTITYNGGQEYPRFTFNGNISGLVANTTYCVETKATNTAGTANSTALCFRTLASDSGSGSGSGTTNFVIATKGTNGIGETWANLQGEIQSMTGASSVDYYFSYWKDGQNTIQATGIYKKTTTGTFDIQVNGLLNNTKYCFKAIGKNSSNYNQISEGSTLCFTTGANGGSGGTTSNLSVATRNTSEYGSNWITFKGEVLNISNTQRADYYFSYRQDGGSWKNTPSYQANGTGAISVQVTNLENNTRYCYKAVLKDYYNSNNITEGSEICITTGSNGGSNNNSNIGVQTLLTNDYGTYWMSLKGEITRMTNTSKVEYYFSYRKDGGIWQSTGMYQVSNTGLIYAQINGLDNNARYCYKAIARDYYSPSITAEGSEICITTGSSNSSNNNSNNQTSLNINTLPYDYIADTYAVLKGEITNMGNSSKVDYWFEYYRTGEQSYLTSRETKNSIGGFSNTVYGLTPDTLYCYKAIGANNYNTNEWDSGTEYCFRTLRSGQSGSSNNNTNNNNGQSYTICYRRVMIYVNIDSSSRKTITTRGVGYNVDSGSTQTYDSEDKAKDYINSMPMAYNQCGGDTGTVNNIDKRTYYYCKNSTGQCVATNSQYENATNCEYSLRTYLAGISTNVCFSGISECTKYCRKSSYTGGTNTTSGSGSNSTYQANQYYYCQTSDNKCVITDGKYANTTICSQALSIYKPGVSTNICFETNDICTKACGASSTTTGQIKEPGVICASNETKVEVADFSEITDTARQFNGKLTCVADKNTVVGFEYYGKSETAKEPKTIWIDGVKPTIGQEFIFNKKVEGLEQGIVYCYKAVAKITAGQTYYSEKEICYPEKQVTIDDCKAVFETYITEPFNGVNDELYLALKDSCPFDMYVPGVADKEKGFANEIANMQDAYKKEKDNVSAQLKKAVSRNGFAKFFIGPNYGAIKAVQKFVNNNKTRIQDTENLSKNYNSQYSQMTIARINNLLEKENQEINDSLTKAGKGFSLFGWLFKIFS